MISEFYNATLELFGIVPRIWLQKPSFEGKSKWVRRVYVLNECDSKYSIGLFCRTSMGRELNGIYGNFAIGKSKKVTKEILQSSKEFKISFVRAFFDDEGSVYDNGHMIKVHQDNTQILNAISMILNQFNISTNPLRFYWKRNKKRYYFTITGFYNYQKYLDIIGFTSQIKQAKLIRLVEKVGQSPNFRLPKGQTKTMIINILMDANNWIRTQDIITLLKHKCLRIKRDESTVIKHLKELKEKGMVENMTKGRDYLWRFLAE